MAIIVGSLISIGVAAFQGMPHSLNDFQLWDQFAGDPEYGASFWKLFAVHFPGHDRHHGGRKYVRGPGTSAKKHSPGHHGRGRGEPCNLRCPRVLTRSFSHAGRAEKQHRLTISWSAPPRRTCTSSACSRISISRSRAACGRSLNPRACSCETPPGKTFSPDPRAREQSGLERVSRRWTAGPV